VSKGELQDKAEEFFIKENEDIEKQQTDNNSKSQWQ
jgi:hypothetical protein